MDKTLENVMMCSKAHEIQDEWVPSVGDDACGNILYDETFKFIGEINNISYDGRVCINCRTVDNYFYGMQVSYNRSEIVWIPWSAQLSSIGSVSHGHTFDKLSARLFHDEFIEWWRLRGFKRIVNPLMMFVMNYKYGNVWDGSEWVIE